MRSNISLRLLVLSMAAATSLGAPTVSMARVPAPDRLAPAVAASSFEGVEFARRGRGADDGPNHDKGDDRGRGHHGRGHGKDDGPDHDKGDDRGGSHHGRGHGKDDGPDHDKGDDRGRGHHGRGHGKDDGPEHTAIPGSAPGAFEVARRGRGADDASGHSRHGRGKDDAPNHG